MEAKQMKRKSQPNMFNSFVSKFMAEDVRRSNICDLTVIDKPVWKTSLYFFKNCH